jgi:phytoene desaturase
MSRPRAIIIGAGLGGLATAIRLAAADYSVTVVEKNLTIGGRCNRLERDGFIFDTGPTLLLMRDVVEELFRSVGRRLEEYVDLIRVDPNYRIRFGDGSTLTISTDAEAMEQELERFSPGSSPGFRAYIQDAKYKYTISRQRFVERNFLRLRDFATLPNLRYMLKTNTLRSLQAHAGRYFADPRLRSAFTFQTMYLGLPPSAAPAVYSLLVYTELAEGIWFPRGGMYQLALALEALARELGVTIELGVEAKRIAVRGRRAVGVDLGGDVIPAEVIVSNVDLPYTYKWLLPAAAQGRILATRLPRLNYGSSAYLLFMGCDRSYGEAAHHTVYLSKDVAANYRAVFTDRRLPADPSMYLCCASRTDPSMAPRDRDGIYVLVPVPCASPNVDWRLDEPAFRSTVLARLNSLGFDRQSVSFIDVTTPDDLSRLYNLVNGSAFGLSHNFSQVGYMRPANRARGLENVYFCGASTVPGGGVPMVIIGSRLTAERIISEQECARSASAANS